MFHSGDCLHNSGPSEFLVFLEDSMKKLDYLYIWEYILCIMSIPKMSTEHKWLLQHAQGLGEDHHHMAKENIFLNCHLHDVFNHNPVPLSCSTTLESPRSWCRENALMSISCYPARVPNGMRFNSCIHFPKIGRMQFLWNSITDGKWQLLQFLLNMLNIKTRFVD